jgi:hypothetical protein
MVRAAYRPDSQGPSGFPFCTGTATRAPFVPWVMHLAAPYQHSAAQCLPAGRTDLVLGRHAVEAVRPEQLVHRAHLCAHFLLRAASKPTRSLAHRLAQPVRLSGAVPPTPFPHRGPTLSSPRRPSRSVSRPPSPRRRNIAALRSAWVARRCVPASERSCSPPAAPAGRRSHDRRWGRPSQQAAAAAARRAPPKARPSALAAPPAARGARGFLRARQCVWGGGAGGAGGWGSSSRIAWMDGQNAHKHARPHARTHPHTPARTARSCNRRRCPLDGAGLAWLGLAA